MKTETKTVELVLQQTPVSSKQLLVLLQKTPEDHKYTRPAKGGGTWDYVTGVYVKKTLNYVFGWLWSFDIISIEEKHKQIVCQGKLTINQQNGKPLFWKTDIGRADIKYKTEYVNNQKVQTENPLDYGNDQKAAATDCLKRCAFQLGIASDIYGKNEFKEIKEEVANKILSDIPDVIGESKQLDEATKKQLRVCKTSEELIATANQLQRTVDKDCQKELLKEYMICKENLSEGVKNENL